MTMWQTMDARDRRALMAGVSIIVLMVVGFRGLPAWTSWHAQARARASETRAHAQRVEAVLTAFPESLDSLEARSERLLERAPGLLVGDTPAASATRLVDVVTGMAREALVRVDDAKVRHDSAGAHPLPRLTLDLVATADVAGLASFLNEIDSGPVLLAVRRIRIRPERVDVASDQVESLRVELTIEGAALTSRVAGAQAP